MLTENKIDCKIKRRECNLERLQELRELNYNYKLIYCNKKGTLYHDQFLKQLIKLSNAQIELLELELEYDSSLH